MHVSTLGRAFSAEPSQKPTAREIRTVIDPSKRGRQEQENFRFLHCQVVPVKDDPPIPAAIAMPRSFHPTGRPHPKSRTFERWNGAPLPIGGFPGLGPAIPMAVVVIRENPTVVLVNPPQSGCRSFVVRVVALALLTGTCRWKCWPPLFDAQERGKDRLQCSTGRMRGGHENRSPACERENCGFADSWSDNPRQMAGSAGPTGQWWTTTTTTTMATTPTVAFEGTKSRWMVLRLLLLSSSWCSDWMVVPVFLCRAENGDERDVDEWPNASRGRRG